VKFHFVSIVGVCLILVSVTVVCANRPRQKAKNEKANITTSASLPIDKYKLDMSIQGLSGLTEFSDTEYAIFGRHFDSEINFHAPEIKFINRQWKVDLGTVRGMVYKIALYFESDNKDTVTNVSADLMLYCQQLLGKPSQQNDLIYIWDTSDGNVVMQLGKVESTYMINLFETSRSVKSFKPNQ
jgi:hypothetical protein